MTTEPDEMPPALAADEPAWVESLRGSFDRMADALNASAASNRELAAKYDKERTFRRRSTAAISGIILVVVILIGIVGQLAIGTDKQQESDKVESCLRAQVFRNDLYDGFEVYGTIYGRAIAEAIPEVEDAQAILDNAATEATAGVAKTIPQRKCDG